jgi:flagellar assembly protein FliH
MRSLDSPVLKPPLIRISSARLIGPAATPESDDERAAAASRWIEALSAGGDGDAAPEPLLSVPDMAEAPDAPGQAPPPTARHIVSDTAAVTEDAPARRLIEDTSARLIEDTSARLIDIQGQIAEAETRVAETQELLDRLEREANLACAMAEDARQQAATIREEARQEGYTAGVEQAEHDMTERLAAATAVSEGVVRARAEFLKRSEPDIIELVFEIARKVIGQHLSLDREAVADVARRALSIAGEADEYYLHLHPDDAELVEQHLRRDTMGMAVRVVPDDRLCPGDCLVQTTHGRVDARIDTQLHEIREQLVGDP